LTPQTSRMNPHLALYLTRKRVGMILAGITDRLTVEYMTHEVLNLKLQFLTSYIYSKTQVLSRVKESKEILYTAGTVQI
jgi:hypothetical protein